MNSYELMVIFTPVLSNDEYKAEDQKSQKIYHRQWKVKL
jgi:ribosomal protein S6